MGATEASRRCQQRYVWAQAKFGRSFLQVAVLLHWAPGESRWGVVRSQEHAAPAQLKIEATPRVRMHIAIESLARGDRSGAVLWKTTSGQTRMREAHGHITPARIPA